MINLGSIWSMIWLLCWEASYKCFFCECFFWKCFFWICFFWECVSFENVFLLRMCFFWKCFFWSFFFFLFLFLFFLFFPFLFECMLTERSDPKNDPLNLRRGPFWVEKHQKGRQTGTKHPFFPKTSPLTTPNTGLQTNRHDKSQTWKEKPTTAPSNGIPNLATRKRWTMDQQRLHRKHQCHWPHVQHNPRQKVGLLPNPPAIKLTCP